MQPFRRGGIHARMRRDQMRCVLIIDDNPSVGEALSLALSLRDIRPLVALTPQDGLATLAHERVDVVIQDMNFTADTTSGEEGVALFKEIRACHFDLPVILPTTWTHQEAAVELVKAGAADYLAKPWDDTEAAGDGGEPARSCPNPSVNPPGPVSSATPAPRALESRYDLDGLVFASEAMSRIDQTVACPVARSDVPVLVYGAEWSVQEQAASRPSCVPVPRFAGVASWR